MQLHFSPRSIRSYAAVLTVTAASLPGLCWSFPLLGLGEGRLVADVLTVEGRAKERSESLHELRLQGMAEQSEEKETTAAALSASVEMEDAESVGCCLAASVDGCRALQVEGEAAVSVRLVFLPLKPLDARCALLLTQPGGGRWRFPVRLLAAEGAADDVIQLEAAVGAAQAADFQLRNSTDRAAPYRVSAACTRQPAAADRR